MRFCVGRANSTGDVLAFIEVSPSCFSLNTRGEEGRGTKRGSNLGLFFVPPSRVLNFQFPALLSHDHPSPLRWIPSIIRSDQVVVFFSPWRFVFQYDELGFLEVRVDICILLCPSSRLVLDFALESPPHPFVSSPARSPLSRFEALLTPSPRSCREVICNSAIALDLVVDICLYRKL